MLQQEFSISDALAETTIGGEGGGAVEATGEMANTNTQYVFLVIEAMYNAAQGYNEPVVTIGVYCLLFRQEQHSSHSLTSRAVPWTRFWRN